MKPLFKTVTVLFYLFWMMSRADAQNAVSEVLPDAPSQVTQASRHDGGTAGVVPSEFPSAKRQFGNYVFSVFGPPGLIASAIGAGLDHRKPEPDSWDSGAKGYGERFGSRFGMRLVGQTTAYSLGAVFKEDVTYHRCECSGFIHRTTHAFTSTVISRNRTGGSRLSVPLLVSPYAGSFTAVSAWYPDNYGASDAARLGSTSFLFRAAGNLIAEFLAPPR